MQQKQLADKPEVLFLVSPNLGLLDSWLPVFWELKKRQPEIIITAVFPKASIVSEIDPGEVSTELAQSVINEVMFKSRTGMWVTTEKLAEAKELVDKHRALNRFIGKIRRVLGASRNDNAALARLSVKAICFDVFAKTKPDCRVILKHFPRTPRFSILHGLAIEDFETKGGDYDRGEKVYRTTAYVHSKHEIAAYERNYGLDSSEVKVTGVPRHEPGWIRTVLHNAQSDIPVSWDKYIFLISRPALDGFFPREKKREALRNIQKLAEELHSKIVVRLHPTERVQNDGLYEEVFGEASRGETWMYSSSHPFMIGKGSLFAITFYSGVAVDMLALGVPTIQMVDLESRGKTGAIMEYKKKGLVLGADNYEELKQQALRVMKEKDAVMRQLMPSYNEYFRPVGNPIQTIANDIVKVLQ